MSHHQFFAFSKPYNVKREPTQSGFDDRPAMVRRLECYTCEYMIQSMFPKDDEGNEIPKYQCRILDIENEKIEQENSKRHPSEQLKYGDCIWGPLENTLPSTPRNSSDYVARG
jgi:hypothetical protein